MEDLVRHPPAAGTAVLNGVGELTGSMSIGEMGIIEAPIVLTGTSSVGRMYDAVVDAMYDAVPTVGVDDVIAPVVGECDDSWLDEARRRHVTVADGRAAIAEATGGPGRRGGRRRRHRDDDDGAQGRHRHGVAGAWTGWAPSGCCCWPTSAVAGSCAITGRAVGRVLDDEAAAAAAGRGDAGSCIGIVLTDIPLDARQLCRVARRVGLGLARVGSTANHGSGEIFCAVSTTNRQPRDATGVVDTRVLGDGSINDVFAATVDATEEAACNVLFVADTVVGRDGHTAPGLPVERVLELLGH